MKLVISSPEMINAPDIIDASRFDTLLANLNFPQPDEVEQPTKKTDLISFISNILYYATGQFFSEKEMTLTFSNAKETKKIKTPYRLKEIISVKIDDKAIDLSNFRYSGNEIFYSECFPVGDYNIEIIGNFGYSADEIPESIIYCFQLLLRDLYFFDDIDSLKVRAKEVKIDVLEFVRSSTYGNVSGDEDVDRIIKSYTWNESPIIKERKRNTSGVRYYSTS